MQNIHKICAVFLLSVSAVYADPNVIWNYNYGGAATDRVECVRPAENGGWIAAGIYNEGASNTYGDVMVYKLDDAGNPEWNREYGWPENDCAYSITELSHGGFVLAGTADQGMFGLDGDILVMKVDDQGDTVWTRKFDYGELDVGYEVLADADENIYIGGGIDGDIIGFHGEAFLLRLTPDGDQVWMQTYEFATQACAYAMDFAHNGGFILAGAEAEDNYGGYGEILLLKTDDDGNLEWSRNLGAGRARNIKKTSDGGYVISGSSIKYYTTDRSHCLIKTDSEGNIEWTKSVCGLYYGEGAEVVETDDGGFLSAGYHLTVKTDADGSIFGVIPNWDNSYFYSLSPADGGNFTASGLQYSPGGGYGSSMVMQFDDALGSVIVDIEPEELPLVVPQGGSFTFDVEITNTSDETQTVMLRLFGNRCGWAAYHMFFEKSDLEIAPGEVISRDDIQQFVPPQAIPGIYSYEVFLYENVTEDLLYSQYFLFEVIAGDGDNTGDGEWQVTGWDDEISMQTETVTGFELHPAFPNPFNPETVITFSLPAAADISLTVYDLQGRLVAELADGFYPAGTYQKTFNAEKLSSGIYFARMTAAGHQQTEKLILLR